MKKNDCQCEAVTAELECSVKLQVIFTPRASFQVIFTPRGLFR